jgi:electron transfer flavoprotein alpha subunit
MRDPISLTPEILAMLDRHEPDKAKQTKLLTSHLLGKRVLPSTEEKLQLHLERKAKREAERQLVVAKAEAHRVAQVKHAEAAQHAKTARVIASFAKRAKEAVLAVGATLEDAEIAATTATKDPATAFADATSMQE